MIWSMYSENAIGYNRVIVTFAIFPFMTHTVLHSLYAILLLLRYCMSRHDFKEERYLGYWWRCFISEIGRKSCNLCWTGDTLTLNSNSLRHDFCTWQLGLSWQLDKTTLTTSFHFLPRHSKRLHRHQKHWHLFEGLEGFWKHFTCYYWVTINII